MADPLSLTASVITVIAAVDSVAKLLAKIRSIKNAPDELFALNNKVSDLRIILGDIEGYALQNLRTSQQEQLQHMRHLLDRAKDSLQDLDILIQYRLVKPGNRMQVSRREWAKAITTIKDFRRSLRDMRLNIVSQMITLDSSFQSRIGLTIDEIHVQVDEHTRLLSHIINSQSDLRGLLRFGTSSDDLTRTGTEQTRAQSYPSSTANGSSNSVVSIRAYAWNHQRNRHPSCCSCACHNPCRSKSLHVFTSFLGALYIGYSGNPLSRSCTAPDCQARPASWAYVKYLFPSWFLSKMLTLIVITTLSHEMTISLNVRRIVAPGSEIFRIGFAEDIDGLKTLFNRGLASPNDSLAITGCSILSRALHRRCYKACSFLLQAGADPHLENHTGMSAFGMARKMIFEAPEDRASYILREMFPDNGGYLDEYRFSKLHTIILGITSGDLEGELAIGDTEIDVLDSYGNTALVWAARRGDVSAVKLLLEARADPNATASVTNHDAALLCAARSCNTTVIKLLLKANADPAQVGMDNNNSLHHLVASGDNKKAVECLLAAGVDINGKNAFGCTPLVYTFFSNALISAQILLDWGADINAPGNQGDTALLEFLYYHNDDLMELLLNRGANYNFCDSAGSSVLHPAAISGGIRTLEILLAACLKNVDPQALNPQGKTALQLAQQRQTKEEGFVEKFEILITDISNRNARASEWKEMEDAAGAGGEEGVGVSFMEQTGSATANQSITGPSSVFQWREHV